MLQHNGRISAFLFQALGRARDDLSPAQGPCFGQDAGAGNANSAQGSSPILPKLNKHDSWKIVAIISKVRLRRALTRTHVS
jgi:hypothetical protein